MSMAVGQGTLSAASRALSSSNPNVSEQPSYGHSHSQSIGGEPWMSEGLGGYANLPGNRARLVDSKSTIFPAERLWELLN